MITSGASESTENLDSASGRHTTLAEARTVERDQRLLTISEIAKISVTERATEIMLHKLLACLVETFEAAEAGVLLLYDPSDGWLAVQAAHGYDLAKLEQIRIAPGEARCGRAFQTGQPELYSNPKTIAAAIANMTAANREVITAATVGLQEPQSAICIPLISGETKMGVLMLENLRNANSFVPADLPFLQTVADLIALSIEGARLRENSQSAQALSEANRLKADPSEHTREEVGYDSMIDRIVSDAYSKSNPMEREMALDKFRWNNIENISGFDPFTGKAVLAYTLRLMLSKRWADMNSEDGTNRADDIINKQPEDESE